MFVVCGMMISKAVRSLICICRFSCPKRPREMARNRQLPSPIAASGLQLYLGSPAVQVTCWHEAGGCRMSYGVCR